MNVFYGALYQGLSVWACFKQRTIFSQREKPLLNLVLVLCMNVCASICVCHFATTGSVERPQRNLSSSPSGRNGQQNWETDNEKFTFSDKLCQLWLLSGIKLKVIKLQTCWVYVPSYVYRDTLNSIQPSSASQLSLQTCIVTRTVVADMETVALSNTASTNVQNVFACITHAAGSC